MAPRNNDADTIMAYLNTDHQDCLIRYLQYYAHLSAFAARNAYISSVTLSSLTICSSYGTEYTIPFQSPMTAWSDIRSRIVAMDMEAIAGLKKSDITVKRYTPPKGFIQIAVLTSVVGIFALFSRKAHFLPGSLIHDAFLREAPEFAQFCLKVRSFVLSSMVIIHAGEAMHMQRNKLEKHTVRMLSGVWWMWLLSTFVEGIGSFFRFAEVVREEGVKKVAAR